MYLCILTTPPLEGMSIASNNTKEYYSTPEFLTQQLFHGLEYIIAPLCHVCEKTLQARSLQSHLESSHDIYQQVVVADDLLEERTCTSYEAERAGRKEPSKCPFPGCPGKLSSTYMLRRHFAGTCT